jgi:hypothetical protein
MIATRAALTLAALTLAVSSACARDNPPPAARVFELGTHRVQVTVPAGWDALDQGALKRFRKGEFEIVFQALGPSTSLGPGSATRPPQDADFDALIDWGLVALGAGVGHDQPREVKSRRPVTVDGREALDIETWSRLDHTNPQRIFFVRDDGELLALHTERMAFADTLAAFDAIRDSLHVVSTGR